MPVSDLRRRVAESVDILKNQSPYADIYSEIHDPIGDLVEEKKTILANIVKEMISEDYSHYVTGVYMIDNISSRPENVFVIIGKTHIILNVSTDQILIIENNATQEELQFVKDLIVQIAEVFVFGSGSGLISSVTELEYDDRSDNIVFELEDIKLTKLGKYAEKFDYVDLLDPSEEYDEDTLAAFAQAIWNYDLERFRSIDTHHIVALNDKSQPMGGARVNGQTENIAVIGGVKTLQVFRQQGVGTGVSQVLSGLLVKEGKQVVLETDDENIPAIKIYEKLGYKRVGESIFLDFGTSKIPEIQAGRDY